MSSPDKPAKKQIPNLIKFVLGGLAGMTATCVVQPLDLVKIRMQISTVRSGRKEYKSSFHCLSTIIAKEGPLALYKGIGAGLLRQATYTAVRLGVYATLNEQYKMKYTREPTFLGRMSMGILAGSSGAFVGTPADVALIRMTADGRLPVEQRRNYTNVANALIRIIKEEGVATLWRGCIATVSRAIVVNMTQLATYSQAKSFLSKDIGMTEGIALHFFSAMLSGFVTTTASMPVDTLKTRIQNMKSIDGKPAFKGTFDVLTKVIKHEGILALWKGFTPYYARLGTSTVLILTSLEQYNRMYYKYVLRTTGGSSL